VRGTLAAREAFDALVEGGQYVITLTAVADPTTVYFTSETLTLDRQTRVAFAIHDGTGEGTSAIKVTEFRDRGATLVDRNVATELRIAHAAPEAGRLDTFIGSDFSAPYVANLAFAQTSAYKAVDATELLGLDLDVTPAGNPFVFLARKQIDLTKGERSTYFLLGSSAVVDGLKSSDSVRRLATHAQLRLVNGATRTLDFYVADHDKNNINTLSATAVVTSRSSTGFQRFDPGRYDIVLTRTGTKTVAYGPYVADLAGGGVYTIVSADTGESTAARVVLFDDFQTP
jgi:trimeric autotransporter adhesin